MNAANPEELRREILRLTREYAAAVHGANRPGTDPRRPAFKAGTDAIPYAGRVFDEEEVEAAVASSLDFWLTLGREGDGFEKELASYLGVHASLLVNSGSSANLLAVATLFSHRLPAERRIFPGDEIITCSAGFPTTAAPIIQNGAVAVFVDCDPRTGNVDASRLEEAYCPGKTKAVFFAHTLGNPFDLAAVLGFCRRHGLWLLEDNCDALGSVYEMPVAQARELGLERLLRLAEVNAGTENLPCIRHGRLFARTGAWGDLSTQSFYPPHHLTTGEGGAVNVVSQALLRSVAESLRDWGRDCWCPSGKDNTCHKRFGWQLGELPQGYDHKYIYSHLGYNLKPLDLQAGIGRRQLIKLPEFVAARRRNWELLRRHLADLGDMLDFALPTHAKSWSKDTGFTWDDSGCRCECSWFGFLLLVRDGAPFTHSSLARHLDQHRIGNRMLFGGNLLRQPAFTQLKKDRPEAFRVCGGQEGADRVMARALFLGTYPGLNEAMIEHEVSVIRDFVAKALAR